jgi:hypothetical protein
VLSSGKPARPISRLNQANYIEKPESTSAVNHAESLPLKINLRVRRLHGIIVCCSLALTPCLVAAQSAKTTELAELPPAPEPHLAQNSSATSAHPAQTSKQSSSTSQSPQQGNEPSLGDLGFTPEQTQPNAQLQALLDKRTRMLKIHQKLGLITAIPMAAALITGPMAKAKGRNGQTIRVPTQANLDLHAALGSATAALYFTTAYFAIFAPKVPGVKSRGAIRLHRALAFIHGPGMIAAPILGAMAFKQEQAGEKVHGIASAHGAVAWTTALAYGAAIVSVSWPIKIHF